MSLALQSIAYLIYSFKRRQPVSTLAKLFCAIILLIIYLDEMKVIVPFSSSLLAQINAILYRYLIEITIVYIYFYIYRVYNDYNDHDDLFTKEPENGMEGI